MPPLVNHEMRRTEVAAATATLIATRGLDAVTVREVADATGFSTAVVSHYFTDKHDLLLFTYRSSALETEARLDAAEAADAALEAFLAVFLPLDEPRRRDWQVWVAFWGKAIADPDFAAEQRRWVTHARGRIEARLGSSTLAAAVDHADTARLLLSTLMGIATQAAFDPADWPPDRQRAALARAVASVGHHTSDVRRNGQEVPSPPLEAERPGEVGEPPRDTRRPA